MKVQKRNGVVEDVSFDKVLHRIQAAADTLEVDSTLIAQRTLLRMYDGVKTTELDELAAQLSISLMTTHLDYGTLASRIAISNHHRNTSDKFTDVVEELSHQITKSGEKLSIVSQQLIDLCDKYADQINQKIDYQRDYLFDYFGFKTLEKQHYLLRDTHGRVVERPQHLMMRVSLALWGSTDLNQAFETYDLLSQKYFIHATPTNFNAGTPRQQLSSCFLLAMKGPDSIAGIYDTLKDCAIISKHAGGIGLHIHDIRAKGSLIRGTNGTSNGIVPMLRNFNDTARYVDQGGGKRNGSFAIYLEPWHADVEDFLRLKLNTGSEEERCRDLFYALWIPDLFMERVEQNGQWTLFCPSEAPGLADVVGDKFKALYERYEQEGRGRKTVDAQKLWFKVLDSQIETGTPYLLYKDACNQKSNQKNLGTIKSSNLCSEIVEFSSDKESAVCNLASLALPSYVDAKKRVFDFDKLREVVKVAIRNLNRVIDINFYPTAETHTSNMRHRPVGLGVQGLADVFAMLRMPWESEKAAELNQRIFEHIYYAAVESSFEIAMKEGPYQTYEGSPMSKGIFQYDMWITEGSRLGGKPVVPLTQKDNTLDWDALKENVHKYGVRNSLLLAPMPTASTSQILGYNECIEPVTSNIYTRRTLSGEFIVVNKYLMRDLQKLEIWNEMMKQQIIAQNGSVQGIDQIPDHIQALYKTSWEIKQKTLIDMAAARGAFICQSQSLNLFVADPNYAKLTSMHFYAWKKGLKTGIYYLRTRAPVMAQKFTIDPELQKAASKSEQQRILRKQSDKQSDKQDQECTMCGS